MNFPDEPQLFAEALGLPLAQRGPFLERVCRNQPGLRQQIERLLEAHDSAGRFMATSPLMAAGLRALPQLAASEPAMPAGIGRYQLLQKIGEGGCGVVYLAMQEEPVRRRVAVKVIKLGMDTKEVIARFEGERQALAMMDHPHIARVFDGGATETGRPYFVMELVSGVPITKYCDGHRLGTGARLELFMQVCHAVQHAHQKGIIHRDLKPSNVLVSLQDGRPSAKVIDFGIAKAAQGMLTDRTLFTAWEQFVGTPAYMSPEQAASSGLDIDTRTDIYSLGVLLYELLTGRPPFDPRTLQAAGLDEIRRIIREVEPPRPSTRLDTLSDSDRATLARERSVPPMQLTSLLRGDLDWIVMRCLEKERTRRYETANALAMDLQRHLHDEPVVARPPSAAYRFKKLVRRNRIAVAATAAVSAALVTGTVVSLWQAVRARHAEEAARNERAEAIAARNSEARLRMDAEDSARTAAREAAISAAVNAFLQNDLLAQASPNREPDRDITLRTVLDRAALKVDRAFPEQPLVEAAIRVTLASTYSALGEFAEAGRHLSRALALRERLLGIGNAHTLGTVGSLLTVYRTLEKNSDAEMLARRVLTAIEPALGSAHPESLKLMGKLASIYVNQGKLVEAEKLHRAVLERRTRILGREHRDTAAAISNLAYVVQREGKLSEAVQLYTEVLAIRRRVLGPEHRDTIATLSTLGTALQAHGRLDEAGQHHAEALALRRRVLGHEHPDTLGSLSNLAYVCYSQGKFDQAVALHSEALAGKERVLGAEHPSTLTTMGYLAAVRESQGKMNEAAALHTRVVEIRTKVFGPDHSSTLSAMTSLAGVLRNARKFSEAIPLYERILENMRRTLGSKHPRTLAQISNLASACRIAGKIARAGELQAEALALRREVLGPEHPDTLESMSFLAGIWRTQKKFPEAIQLLAQVLAVQKRVIGAPHRETLWTWNELGQCFLQTGAFAEAETLLRDSLAVRLAARPDDWRTALNQLSLGEALVGLRRFAEAEPLLAAGLEGLKTRLSGIQSGYRMGIRTIGSRIGKLYVALGETELAAEWQSKFDALQLPAPRPTRAAPAEVVAEKPDSEE